MQNNEKKLEFPNDYAEILKKNKETFQFISEIEKDVREEDNAEKFMSEKTYSKDNKELKAVAIFTSYFTSLFSIASGLYFLYSTFLLILYFDILSWIVSIVLLVLLERTKHISTGKSLELYYRNHTPIAYFLFVFILICLSTLFSIKGVEAFYSQVMHEKPIIINTNNIAKEYETRIREIEKQRKEFTNSISWQGQINIYDAQVRNSLANFDTQISKLREEKNKATQKADTQNNNTQTENKSKHITSVLYLIAIFGLNEFFCMLSLWYIAHYRYMVNKQKKQREALLNLQNLSSTTKETVNVSEQKPEEKTLIAKPKSIFNSLNSQPIVPNGLKKGSDDLPKNDYSNINNIGFLPTNLGTNVGTDLGTKAGTDTGTKAGTDDFSPKYEVLLACVDEYESTNTIDGRVKKGLNPELRLRYLKFIEENGLDYCKQVLVTMRTEQKESVKKKGNKQNEIF